MKNIFTFLISATFIFFFHEISVAQLPNNSFETWNNNGTYSDPDLWDTPNEALSFMSLFTVTESNEAYEGQKSMKLESGSLFGAVIPGMATLGEIEVDLMSQDAAITGGIPYTERPVRLKGYYQYTPQQSDSCAIIALFYKYNTSTNERDTIGVGALNSGMATTQWTEFSANIDWYSSETPDSTNIIILSTAATTTTAGGSILLVDDLAFDNSVGIDNVILSENDINIYPIPAKSYINIDLSVKPLSNITFEIYNLTGNRVLTSHLENEFQQVVINMLSGGIYFYRISEGESIIKSGKLIIKE